MLVLKRNLGERIMIGVDVVVMVTDVGPGWARIGITAPADDLILREELLAGKPLHESEDDMDHRENQTEGK